MSPVRSKVEIGPAEARYYDLFLNLISMGWYPHFIKEVIEKMDIQEGQAILDLGSGTGRNECFMAEKVGHRGRVLGLDISREMLNIARKRCQSYPWVQFNEKRIEALLGYRGEFDKVFISFVLHGFENDQKIKIIRNAYQVLKPGGSFCILDYNQFEFNKMWFPFRWIFTHAECELAREFLNLDLKGMLQKVGFNGFKENLFLKQLLRLLEAAKPEVGIL